MRKFNFTLLNVCTLTSVKKTKKVDILKLNKNKKVHKKHNTGYIYYNL